MSIYILIGVAVGLAMDAFAVAITCSITLNRVSARQVFRFAFHFGLFQAMMPVIGWLAGLSARQFVEQWDHWIAFGLLAAIGGHMIYGALSGDVKASDSNDPTRGISLVILSVATSIDALAVGLSLAMLDVSIWLPALIIGLITAVLTVIGMLLGNRIGRQHGKKMELIGGLILIAIGLKILISDLFFSNEALLGL